MECSQSTPEARRRWLETFGRRIVFHSQRLGVVGFDHWARDLQRELDAAQSTDEAADMDRRVLAFMQDGKL
jgi:hypothetical protein